MADYTKTKTTAPASVVVASTTVKAEDIPTPAAVVVALEPTPVPSPIFLALLAGEVANRGISWYAAQSASNVKTRITLLKKTAKEIENAYAATVPTVH